MSEVEANRFAGRTLIPEVKYEDFISGTHATESAVRRFARSIGVAPGIVVGRLQHDGIIKRSWLNDVREQYSL